MDEKIRQSIINAVKHEAYAQKMGMKLRYLDDGYSLIEMLYQPEIMDNIYSRAHGGAIFGLIDEAFECSSQTCGTINVALSVNVAYTASPMPGLVLKAESRQISRTRRTAVFNIMVTDEAGNTIATCQAVAYDTGKPIPFMEEKT